MAQVVGGTMHGALAGRALPCLEQHVRACRFRRTSSPCFDRGHGVALADEVALDHSWAGVERFAAASTAAVVAGIVRSGAREQAEGASAIDEASL